MSLGLSNPSPTAGIPPKIGPPARFPVWPVTILGAGILAGAAVLFWFNPVQSRFYPFCLFHQMTGLHCPGCGSLRALHQLLHGHLLAALHSNLLLVLALPLGTGWTLHALRRSARGQSATLSAAWLWTGLVLLLLFGVLRNLPFAPFTWLAPP